jgi:LacI family transcriptional regulator
MKKVQHITLRDIAKRAKVSKVTVSKALRGHPDISYQTAKKIQALASELGYYPNFMARNLSSNQSRTIGVVVPKIAHFFFSSVIEAIYDVAFEQNYEIILTVSLENAERELRHMQTLLSMRVDGIIISVTQQTKDYLVFHKAKDMGIPVTFMDRVVYEKGFNSVVADDRGGAYAAVEQAVHVGYKKIGHLAGYSHTSIGKERLHGFKSALEHYGVPLKKEWIVPGGFSEEDGYNGLMKMHNSGRLPEFLLTVTFPVALGVYRAAEELGMKIPGDLDIISFGNSGLNQFLSPPMSYIEQPTVELGRKAVELTVESIQQKNEFSPQKIILPTKLVLCKTCIGNGML